MYLTCPICNSPDLMKELFDETGYKHICKNEDILSFIKKKDAEISSLTKRVYNLENGIKTFCFKNRHNTIDASVCYVDKKTVEDLYQVCSGHDSLIDFTRLYSSLYSCWIETLELFCDKPSRSYKSGNYLEKFNLVRTHLVQAYRQMFDKESRKDNRLISSEELLTRIKSECKPATF